MPYFNIPREEYIRINNKIEKFIHTVATYYNIELSNLRYKHYIHYCQNVLNTSFTRYPLGNDISGMTVREDYEYYAIGINSDDILTKQRFSAMHEIIHRVFHFNNSVGLTYFADFNNSNSYSEYELPFEKEAEIGASLLIANDNVIENLLKRQFSFNNMVNELECSKSSLHSRLINYVQYNLNTNNKKAKSIAYDFRYKKSNELFLMANKNY